MNFTWSPDEPSGVSGLHLSDTGKTLIFYLIGWTPPGLHLDSTWTHKFNILFNSYLLIIIIIYHKKKTAFTRFEHKPIGTNISVITNWATTAFIARDINGHLWPLGACLPNRVMRDQTWPRIHCSSHHYHHPAPCIITTTATTATAAHCVTPG